MQQVYTSPYQQGSSAQVLTSAPQAAPGKFGLTAAQRSKPNKTERLIIQELGCQLGLMICETNRLKYNINKKNHEIAKVIDFIRADPNVSGEQIITLLDAIVDKIDVQDAQDDQVSQNGASGQKTQETQAQGTHEQHGQAQPYAQDQATELVRDAPVQSGPGPQFETQGVQGQAGLGAQPVF